ncbi:toll/interleukin-1 receptor domain-containing protein [Pseudolabrys sp.]|uniref:toll/interleukin-1 receptor domain-containing protein n=1 Tax=Pseudolabrys sp. TaxID=1960880 RepID=UPI003D141655
MQIMGNSPRDALFISHATPDDNAFTLWLGAKLTALGYTVFADVLRLRGGDDWERILEDAIRNKAAKVLLAATPHGVQKQGVRNEITIASQVAKNLGDTNFIIPLRLAPFEPQLQIAHAQYLEFSKSWAAGLSDLLALLVESKIPCTGNSSHADMWRGVQLKDARTIGTTPERLTSNWLAIDAVPDQIRLYDFKGGISLGTAQKAIKESPIPLAAFNRGFLSFAPLHQLQEYFGPNLPLEAISECTTDVFLEKGWRDLNIAVRDSRPKFTDLARQGMDAFFLAKGLESFELASGHLAWWPTAGQATTKRLSFRWNDGPSGSRQIVGRSDKRGFHWHYGISCWARTMPVRHMRIAGRVIFTADGKDPIGDTRRLHRMRRSFCKSWRNDKWRDLLLAFWFWLAEGADVVDIPMGDGVAMRLRLPPIGFDASFGIDDQEDSDEDQDESGDRQTSGDEGGEDDPDELDDDE